MDFVKVTLLFACAVAVSAFVPFEEFHAPKPYSFGYKIKDKHGEQHRQEIGDGLHTVKGSYGFEDERGVERRVNYVADKGGFRAEIKTNEPGTASLNPAAVKMESSAHPYFGNPKVIAAEDKAKEGFKLAGGFLFPDIFKIGEGEMAKEGYAFDEGIAKENDLEKDYLSAELAQGGLNAYGLTKEPLIFPSLFAEGITKETEAAKFLEQLLKKGTDAIPFGNPGTKEVTVDKFIQELLKKEATAASSGIPAAKETEVENEGLAFAKILDELAKQGLIYSPVFPKENVLGFKKSELEKEKLGFGKLAEQFPYVPTLAKAPLPFFGLKPTGFAYGGPLKGGIVKGYDARFY